MALSIGGNRSAAKGVFINKGTVLSIDDMSGQVLPYLNKSFDLAVKLTIDIGKSFNKELVIFGDFKKDADGQVASIGAAFKVGRVFETLGITGELTPQNTLPAEWLTAIVGKEVYVLDYAIGVKDDGKTKFASWDRIDMDRDNMLHEFLAEVKKGYPKKYVLWATEQDEQTGDAYEGTTAPSNGGDAAVEDMPF